MFSRFQFVVFFQSFCYVLDFLFKSALSIVVLSLVWLYDLDL